MNTIHLVFEPSLLGALHDALLKQNVRVVGTDGTLEQFSDAAMAGQIEAEVAIVSGTAGIVNKQDSISLLKKIRAANPDLRMIVILPELADRQWITEVGMLGIYDIYPVGQFTIDDLMAWMKQRKTVADIFPLESSVTGKVEQPQSGTQLVEPKVSKVQRKKMKDVLHHAIHLEDEDLHRLVPKVIYRTKLIGYSVVAVGGVRERSGTTHTAIQLAYMLSKHGLKTAFVEYSDQRRSDIMSFSTDFDGAKFRRDGIDFFPGRTVENIAQAFSSEYQVIVLDVGSLFEQTAEGLVRSEQVNEWYRASIQVLTLGAAPWDIAYVANYADEFSRLIENSKSYLVVNYATKRMFAEVFDAMNALGPMIVYNAGGCDPFEINDSLCAIIDSVLPEKKRRIFSFH